MSDDLDFDFDFDDADDQKVTKVDTSEKSINTNTKAKTTRKTSGRKSGKASGSVTRQKRVPMHERMPLSADSRPGFRRRVVNDVPGRIDRLKLAGWTVVEDGTKLGDTYAGQASGVGSQSSKPVGRGINGILMEIPEELYNEDQATKQRMIDETEKAMMVEATDEMSDATGSWHGSIKYHG